MIKGIVTQRSYHGLSYFHLNDVLIDVIPIVLTRHTVVDVILTQVVLTGGKTHKYDEQLCQNTTWTQRMDPLALPKKRAHVPNLNCSDSWKAVSSLNQPERARYLSWTLSEEWYWCSTQGDTVPDVHKPPPSCVIEWHFPLMCLYCFGTQLANWPLIRQAASRAQTVTVEKSIFGERSSSSGSPHCIALCSVKAITVWETHWVCGEASAGTRLGKGPISM